MAKVLVTGGAGYIGSITAHVLKSRGYDVIVMDDLSRGHEHNVAGMRFHNLNTAESGRIEQLLIVIADRFHQM